MRIIFDIDGTLANASHRLHHIVPPDPKPDGWRKDWDAFLSLSAVNADEHIAPMFELLLTLWFDHDIRFATGRRHDQRDITVGWITDGMRANYQPTMKWGLPREDHLSNTVNNRLWMRKMDDRRPSHEVKREILTDLRGLGWNPEMVFEDRADDAAMWRDEGLICCQVAEGNY
jgi:hypothetical protein